MQRHPDAEASGVRLIAYGTLGSNNAAALARGRSLTNPAAGPLIVRSFGAALEAVTAGEVFAPARAYD